MTAEAHQATMPPENLIDCFMGLPTPNLFAGGLLFHNRKEWIPVIALAKSPQVILTLCRLWAEDPTPFAASPAAT